MPKPLSIVRVNLVAQAVETLTREIHAGRWPDLLPPERALGQLLQVSRTTVRATLAELERLRLIRRDAHGRPIAIPAGTRSPTAAIDSVVVLAPLGFEQLGRFELIWLDALRELLAAQGLPLRTHAAPKTFGETPQSALKQLTAQHPRALWVLLRSSEAMQRWFEAAGIGAVVAGSRHDEVRLPCVEIDVEAATRHAAHYLGSRGHHRLAFFVEPSPAAGVRRSEQAFLATAKRDGVAAEIIHHGAAREDFLRALHASLAAKSAPTGLLVERYTHALTALTHLLARGTRWPGPIALLSREDTATFAHTTPGLSAYRFDPLLYARKLARILLDLKSGAPRHGLAHSIEPKLIRRETA